MKILVISDTHLFNDYLAKITAHFRNKVDLMVHCGDSSLEKNDPLLEDYLVVKGNHDIDDFPITIIKDNICITHGHKFGVYYGYDELVQLCKENHVNICFHGHTHVPTYQIHEGIHFINPGSTMINRGEYGFGTFAIVEIVDSDVKVHFYHHVTFEECDFVVKEGLILLEEFKKMLR